MANLRYWEITVPPPQKDIADDVEREWQRITTGQGAAASGIEKSAHWRLWVGFETDQEMYEFVDWFGKQCGMTWKPFKVREYWKDGEDMIDAEMKPEFLH